MKATRQRSFRMAAVLWALAWAGASTAMAAAGMNDKPMPDEKATARCPYGPSNQGRPTCMTQADFEVAKARQAALDKDPAQYMRNAIDRCLRLPAEDRRDCEARMTGRGTASGSVAGGGIYRELVTIEIGAPVNAAPAAPIK